jgi:hypothetical protein
MTEPARARDLNEAARRFAETLADSYRLVYEQAQESAARQQQRAREFSELRRCERTSRDTLIHPNA